MSFELPALPYAQDALAPHISAETLEYHHGKHHQAYVTNLNNLTRDTPLAAKGLDDLVRTTDGAIFNNAAQIWNHTFYFEGLGPNGGGVPGGPIAAAIKGSFSSFDNFKEQFTKAAATLFGSGWAWVVKEGVDKLSIVTTPNAGCPLKQGQVPILTCDVWEHAYYIDYRNARPQYLEAFWNLVNWDRVTERLS